MTDADKELAAILARNPELSVANAPTRPMPDAARQAMIKGMVLGPLLSESEHAEIQRNIEIEYRRKEMERLRPISVTLTLPYPPSVNRMYRIAHNRLVLTEDARTYKIAAGWVAQKEGIAPFTGRIALYVHLYRGHKRGDADNPLKCLQDALNGIAWNDDEQIIELHVWRHDDKQNPRAEVEVREVQP